MRNAYLAVSYICNENCSFCPCSKKEKQDKMITKINELLVTVDELFNKGVSEITLSGGEPTLHPNLVELIAYIQKKDIKVTVLSNGEHFSSMKYISELVEKVNVSELRVITTLHSSNAEEHEKINKTAGSFFRSVEGLKNLSSLGAKVIIKHCITRVNYKDLLDFYKYCDTNFDQNVDVQLCSIDYCGIPKDALDKEKLLFRELRPYLEKLLDYDLSIKKTGNHRKLYCINMPLCACDPYYWAYMPRQRGTMYDQYKDPHENSVIQIKDNVGIHKEYCKNCKVKQICCGTYFTAYDICRESIVSPYL